MISNEKPKNDTFGTLLMVGAGAFAAWKVLTSETAAHCIYQLDQWAKELAAAERRRVELEVRQRLRQVLAEYAQKLQPAPNTLLPLPSPSLPSPTPGEDTVIPSVATYTKEVYVEPDSNWRKRLSILPRSSFLANAGAVNLPWPTASELNNLAPDSPGENNSPELLTGIRDMYTLSTTQNGGEADEVMVRNFLNTLAEVALAIASRKTSK